MRRTVSFWLLATVLAVGCVRQNPAPDGSVGRGESPYPGRQISSVEGIWYLTSDPPQTLPGIHIELTVDSVGDAAFGHLSHFFSGNLGIDPGTFEHFAASLHDDGTIVIDIARIVNDSPGLGFVGSMTTDTITLRSFTIGADTMTGHGRVWFLIKRR
ncbi:MAG: hypothetical protein ACE5HT_00295 [Gemmatimonadales bacterium]